MPSAEIVADAGCGLMKGKRRILYGPDHVSGRKDTLGLSRHGKLRHDSKPKRRSWTRFCTLRARKDRSQARCRGDFAGSSQGVLVLWEDALYAGDAAVGCLGSVNGYVRKWRHVGPTVVFYLACRLRAVRAVA
uniref:hypothetical protein n=1 Tax=Yoonia sp. TaxID=2212373 RepID=UPI004048E7B6